MEIDFTTSIEKLVAADRLEEALSRLLERLPAEAVEQRQELIQHQSALARARRGQRRGEIAAAEEAATRNRVGYALLELLREASATSHPLRAQQPAGSSLVFISYSRHDAAVVARLQSALEAAAIPVCIDHRDTRPGEAIDDFIRRAVTEAGVVLSVVSAQGLLSPWVGRESITTLYDETLRQGRKLIAGYLDEAFLDLGFRLTATAEIDVQIAEIDRLLAAYATEHLDGSDLHRRRSRLVDLRNDLGKILERLRDTVCLDLREPHWEASLARLIAAIRSRPE